jgi:amino acid adenylation domain-containing protein
MSHAERTQAPSIPQLIAAQAELTPTAPAVVASNLVLRYGELNRRANQLAHHLRALGVGPDALVGCCLERSCDLVVGLLGILKAGAAYLPLDPAYPAERLAFMLHDAQVSVLVTDRRAASRLSSRSTQVVCMDADAATLSRQSPLDPGTPAGPDGLAYVIYTSGSTGQPKGVEIQHGNLLNLVAWHHRAFAVTSCDRATQLTSPAFDATGWELWPYLTLGASVHMPEDSIRTMAAELRDWLVSQKITVTFLPTPLAESVMGLEWPSTTSLRLLLTGADTLHRYPRPGLPFAVVNNYGPTETTVVATSGLVPTAPNADVPPSIGGPIANVQVHILDEELRPVPAGVPGELYIGGAGVGLGYVNRPALTAERFVRDPFAKQPNARMYRTGDLGRYLPDGQISFLGRSDHQIKVRGFRVEPDEITSALNRHPAIRTSLVVAREDRPGDRRLVAYLVTVDGARVTAGSLREELAGRLPDYMIPALFVVLDALPVTPNGKVDRAALPAPSETNTLRDAASAAPSTPIEEQLVGILASLLALGRVGVDDNFFLLGGTSMMGAQLVVQMAETYGIEIPLRTLFEKPTARLLAAEVERRIVAKVEAMSEDEVLRLLQ